MIRAIYFSLGCLMVALGVIGAVTPLLPTTVFLIVAAACFARSSPRSEAWLLDHPRFGPTLRDWRSSGAIARPAMITACAGMALGFAVFSLTVRPTMPVAAGVVLLLAGCAAYFFRGRQLATEIAFLDGHNGCFRPTDSSPTAFHSRQDKDPDFPSLSGIHSVKLLSQ